MLLAAVLDLSEDDRPPEEQTPEFLSRLEEAKALSAEWQQACARAEEDAAAQAELDRIEGRLRAEMRRDLGLPPRADARRADPAAVAEERGLPTSYTLSLELPVTTGGPRGASEQERSPVLQTLLFRKDLQARAEALLRKARSAREERGIEIMKLVIGLLHWPESEASRQCNVSPLLVLSVTLERKMDSHLRDPLFFLRAKGEQLERNETSAERLRKDFALELPSLDAEADDPWAATKQFFTDMERLVAARKGWSVEPTLTLAPLSFTRFAIWRDLEAAQWPGCEPAAHPLVFPLLRGVGEPIISGRAPGIDVEDGTKAALTPYLITDADSSQHAATIEAMEGRSLVLEGPPGTGKSQTIVNLIANAIGAGKRVLFVAEKRATLEVVLNRLAERGLDLFALPLHGPEAQPKVVIERIKRRHSLAPSAPRKTALANRRDADEAAATLRQ